MSTKQVIQTNSAPAAIGPYSQAIKIGNFVFTSGQVALDPVTGELNNKTIETEIHQVFKNLIAVINASGATANDIVKLTIFLTDLNNFAVLNTIMPEYFQEPYPARSTIQVSRLPKDAAVEIEAVIFN